MKINRSQIGKKYKVLSDSEEFFKTGEYVIALQEDYVPLCVLEENYKSGEDYKYYLDNGFKVGVLSMLEIM